MKNEEPPVQPPTDPRADNMKLARFIGAILAIVLIASWRAASRSELWKEFWITSVYCTVTAVAVFLLLKRSADGGQK
jgi:hypothetical protein